MTSKQSKKKSKSLAEEKAEAQAKEQREVAARIQEILEETGYALKPYNMPQVGLVKMEQDAEDTGE